MKVTVAALGALVAGIGGGLLAVEQTSIVPSEFATFLGVVWLAVLVTFGIRSTAAALMAGLVLRHAARDRPALLPGLDGKSFRSSSDLAPSRPRSTPKARWPS